MCFEHPIFGYKDYLDPMKKWMIVTLVVAIFLFLVVRAMYFHWGRENKTYTKSLGLHFSATVDSLEIFYPTNGYVYFHVTRGDLNPSTEHLVNQKPKQNNSLQFILDVGKEKQAFHSRDINKYNVGDSLAINSDDDKIYIYRKGKRIAESQISHALNGLPF